MSDVDVSVVLCTYNRASLVRVALESLLCQHTGGEFRYEIVVVNNCSTDNTREVLEELAAGAGVPVRTVDEPRAGEPFVRNRGIAEAHGAWIASIDDDEIADPRWLFELWDTAREADVRCVGGSIRLALPERQVRELAPILRAGLGEIDHGDQRRPYPPRRSAGTNNLLLHRSVFDEVGLYNEEIRQGGCDTDLYRRIREAGIAAWYAPRALVLHTVPAYRLEDRYLRWAFRRHGWAFARRDRDHRGPLGVWALAAARLAQAALVSVPQMSLARFRGDRRTVEGTRCRLWAAEAYLRGAVHLTVPWLWDQGHTAEELQFHSERAMFGLVTEPADRAAIAEQFALIKEEVA